MTNLLKPPLILTDGSSWRSLWTKTGGYIVPVKGRDKSLPWASSAPLLYKAYLKFKFLSL